MWKNKNRHSVTPLVHYKKNDPEAVSHSGIFLHRTRSDSPKRRNTVKGQRVNPSASRIAFVEKSANFHASRHHQITLPMMRTHSAISPRKSISIGE